MQVDDSAIEGDADFGRSGMVGFLLGVAAVTAGITVAGTLGGMGFGPALGVGACAGIWGGGGFGFLIGAVLPVARRFDQASNASTSGPESCPPGGVLRTEGAPRRFR